ncbi:MAG: M28 family peptidase [Bacteroidetes bacterium]|nr:M28 family peptidase [Bacteroidota bacterium]MBS1539648.1 M28 family peptidase [Bacteroidota bacterium]
MKKLLFILLLVSASAFAQDATVTKYADLITPADLKENLSIIASDALEGRYTGSRGQKMAAAYIANHFESVGLTLPANGSYYMPVELSSTQVTDAFIKAGTTKYAAVNELVYMGQSATNGEISLEAIFVGKGSDADLAYLNVKDKAAIIYVDQLSFDAFRSIRKLSTTLHDKGAQMILAVAGGKPEDFTPFATMMKGFTRGSLSLNKPNASPMGKGMFLLSQEVASKILNTPFAKLEKAVKDPAAKKPLAKIKPSRMVYSVSVESKIIKSENMVGFLEGTDKKDEVIVLSAHFDHIGIQHEGEDKINNGADDDGSGTVTILQLAKAFAQAKKDGHGPRRSILFMTVTGEEEGLLGSQYYVEHPIYPLTSTVANLNIDMVGRRDPEHAGKPDYVYVIGSDKLSSELHEINERNNKTYTQLSFDYTYNDENHPSNLYKRSDHWNFAKNNVPIIFYFDGIHEDYHKPSDEVSKIDFDLLAKRGKIVFYTAWELANRDNRITVDKK